MHKKKTIIFIIICFFFLGDRILSRIGIYLTKFSSMPEARLYNGTLESSVVIVGNSRAFRHFYDNEWSNALSKSVKSISKPGAPLVHLETLLNDYSEIYDFPKKIIIELDCLLTSSEIVSSYKFLTHFSKEYSVLLKRFDISGFYFSEIINLYKLNSNIFLNIIHKIFREYEQPKLHGEISKVQVENFIKAKKENRFISKSYNIESFQNIIKKYSGKSELILIVSPFHPEVIKKYDKDINSWITEIRNKTDDRVSIFDYSQSITSNLFFNDLYHLNATGVIELNRILMDDLFFEKI